MSDVSDVSDVSDAFVREPSAAPAAEGRFRRRLLAGGLLGAFRTSPADINAAAAPCRRPPGEETEAQTSRCRNRWPPRPPR